MMRALWLVCAAVLVSITTVPSSAFANDKQVAVLNLQQLMRESKAAQSIREQIESKRSNYQSEIDKNEERLRNRDKELTEQRSLLSPEAFEQERREFKEEVTDVQRDVQVMRASLDKAYSTALAEVQVSISEIIKEMADEKGFIMALPAGQTLYFDDTLDITEAVRARLDKRLPSVEVKVEKVEPAE